MTEKMPATIGQSIALVPNDLSMAIEILGQDTPEIRQCLVIAMALVKFWDRHKSALMPDNVRSGIEAITKGAEQISKGLAIIHDRRRDFSNDTKPDYEAELEALQADVALAIIRAALPFPMSQKFGITDLDSIRRWLPSVHGDDRRARGFGRLADELAAVEPPHNTKGARAIQRAYVRSLAEIWQEVKGKQPTATENTAANYESIFVKFVHAMWLIEIGAQPRAKAIRSYIK